MKSAYFEHKAKFRGAKNEYLITPNIEENFNDEISTENFEVCILFFIYNINSV